MRSSSFYIINTITLYRLAMAPVLVLFILLGEYDLFKWLLPVSFFTDLIDGALARKFKAESIFGSKFDSVADDLTMLAGIIGAFVFKREFVEQHRIIIFTLLLLLAVQNIYSLIKYHKLSSFHTYFAKAAALAQGTFLILLFLLPAPVYTLFFIACLLTFIDLVEEIILVALLDKWVSDVKGLYWVMKRKKLV